MLIALLAAAESAIGHLRDTTPLPVLVIGAILALTSIFVVYKLVCDLLDPLRSIPGPRFARFSRLWLSRAFYTEKFNLINKELHDKLGPVVRLAPGYYSFTSEEAVRTIYNHGGSFTKSDWYKPFGNSQFVGLFNALDKDYHAALRRKVSSVYSMTALKHYESYIDQCTDLYMERLEEFASSGKAMNLHHWNQCYAFDSISLITWSHRLGCLDRGEDVGRYMAYIKADQHVNLVGGLWMEVFESMRPFLQKYQLPGGMNAKALYAYTRTLFNEKIKSPGEPEEGQPLDFVQKLFVAREFEGKTDLTDMNILVAAAANMGAGSDTIGISLSSVMYYLWQNPRVLQKLRQEIQDGYASGELTHPLTYAEANKLPYLQAVIKESLRVHTALSVPMPRIVPAGGTTIHGYFFPAGTIVGVNPYVHHHNPAIYGPDASQFRPERWIEESHHDVDYLSFGMGAAGCIGRNIALLELTKFIPLVVQRFDFERVSGNKEWEVEVSMVTRPRDFTCRVKRREDDAALV